MSVVTRNGTHIPESSTDFSDVTLPSETDSDDDPVLEISSSPFDDHRDRSDVIKRVSTESPKKTIGGQVVTNAMLEEILQMEETVTLTVDRVIPIDAIHINDLSTESIPGTAVAIVHRENDLEGDASTDASDSIPVTKVVSNYETINKFSFDFLQNAEVQFLAASLATSEIDYRQTWQLSAEEINEIKRSTKLTTRHINSALALVRKNFPEIGGLFNVHHATSTGTYPVPKEKSWIQIIHTGKCHWVLAVSGFPVCRNHNVAVYDSLGFERSSEEETVKAISSLLGYTDYSLYAPSCQKQADKSSCGVFALAFAVEVALGADPSTIVFVKEAQMKDHLKGCLRDLELKPFPKTSTSKVQPTRQKVWKITC